MADIKYTQSDLDSLTIHDLRIVLAKLGGVPKLKNRQVLVDEILQIQDGTLIPTRSTRGRKPKYVQSEALERKRAEALERERVAELEQQRAEEAARRAAQIQSGQSVYVGRNTENGNDGYGSQPQYGSGRQPQNGYTPGGRYGGDRVTVTDVDAQTDKMVEAQGVLEIMEGGYGFIRTYDCHLNYPDFYVDRQILRRYGLRTGDFVVGYAINKFDRTSLNVREVTEINGTPVADFKRGRHFDDYPAVYPDEKLVLSAGSNDFALRAIDVISPIGKGQRGLIVAPPKTGKTTLLKKLATSIQNNNPDVYLIVLLIDERPEEVTDFAEIIEKGEVVASTFDESPEKHIKFAEIYLERAKRLVECGKDVVILLDSITKLTRAYNNVIPPSGKLLSGGVDPQALILPKKFFGAARKLKGGASLTVISTALVETGSRMDDVIFEEFKGTGNMEIVLSRHLSERRIFPAIDLFKSGTRNEENLFTKEQLDGVYKLRRFLSQQDVPSEVFLEMVQKTSSTDDLLSRIDAWIKMFG